MFAEFDVVYLSRTIPEVGLVKGQRGVIVDCYGSPPVRFEVEFSDANEQQMGLLTLEPDQISATPVSDFRD